MAQAHYASVESSWVSASLILVALVYLRGWLRLRRLNLDSVQAWRARGFMLSLFLIWLAIASPLSALDHEMLTAHMVQHLLLMTFAAPLILLGAPVKTLLYRPPHRLVQAMGRSFQSTGLHQVWNALTHPVTCWLGAASALVGWHIPAVFVLGLRSQTWHGTSIVSRNWTSVLVAGSPTIADQLEVARIVDTLVSIPGHLAVRYSLWIFGLLRPCGLPGLFLITAAW